MLKRILFMNGPSQDGSDRFFGWPTSLLYAIAPAVQAMRQGRLEMEYAPRIFEPVWYGEGVNSGAIKEEFKELIKGVDIICASVTYDSLYPTYQLLLEAKKLNPRITTILGGPYFDEVLPSGRRCYVPAAIDYAIGGDGEYALLALLRHLEKGSPASLDFSSINGRVIIYANGKMYRVEGMPLAMDGLPFMPIELVDMNRHKNDFDVFSDVGRITPTIQMIAQRGCAYSCNFCSERKELAYRNTRSIDNIVREVYFRKEQGFGAVFFDDSNLGAYPRLKDLLGQIAKIKGMVFGCLERFDLLNRPGVMDLYEKAGFTYFYASIEQFDDHALRRMGKAQTKTQIESAMKSLSERGFGLGVSLLYGLPSESEGSVMATLDFTKEWIDRRLIRLVSESVLSYHPEAIRNSGVAEIIKEGFNRTPPNKGFPFDRFEEGQWYHAPHVTGGYLERIYEMSRKRFRHAMVRERHSWYAKKGYLKKLG
jgi:radical SAM superfamily enzyme YgiQ (UPF0313 family)